MAFLSGILTNKSLVRVVLSSVPTIESHCAAAETKRLFPVRPDDPIAEFPERLFDVRAAFRGR